MINFVVNVFYKLVSKHREKGLLASIWIMTVAVGFNVFSILHVIIGFTHLTLYYDAMLTPVLFVIFFYSFSNYFERKLISMKEFKYINLPWIFYLLGPAYFFLSLIVLPLTFRFLSY
jgi:hypothetical protein